MPARFARISKFFSSCSYRLYRAIKLLGQLGICFSPIRVGKVYISVPRLAFFHSCERDAMATAPKLFSYFIYWP